MMTAERKSKMKGYRTVTVNGLAVAIPVIDQIVNNGAVIGPLLGPHGAAVMAILGVVNIALRTITDSKVGSK